MDLGVGTARVDLRISGVMLVHGTKIPMLTSFRENGTIGSSELRFCVYVGSPMEIQPCSGKLRNLSLANPEP